MTCACLKLRSSAPELKVASLNEARPVKVAPSNEARAGLLDLILRLHTGPVQRFPGLYDPAAAKPAPEDAASLLADLTAFLDDYIVQSAWQAGMVAAWIIGTYVFRQYDVVPYLRISAGPDTGKTTLFKILKRACWMGWMTKPTNAALSREVHQFGRTLLLDNLPAARLGKDFTWLMNVGYDEDGSTSGVEMVAGRRRSVEWSAYSPKAMNGLDLSVVLEPDTLTRCLPVTLVAKREDQEVADWKTREVETRLEPLVERLMEFGRGWDALGAEAAPAPLKGMINRECKLWRPMLEVACYAGADWSKRLSETAVAVTMMVREDAPAAKEDLTPQMARDLYRVWPDDEPKIHSHVLEQRLLGLTRAEFPWAEALRVRAFGQILKKGFGIVAAYSVRPSGRESNRGWERTDFHRV